MRINCGISLETRINLSNVIDAVNAEREKLGLERVNQTAVINEMIARVAEQSTINLCGVFITKKKGEALQGA